MIRRCARCGFAAETETDLPETWMEYVLAKHEVAHNSDDTVTILLCPACHTTVTELLDPRTRNRGRELTPPVREFLSELELDPKQESSLL